MNTIVRNVSIILASVTCVGIVCVNLLHKEDNVENDKVTLGQEPEVKVFTDYLNEDDSSEFLFSVNADTSLAIVGYNGINSNVVIPIKYDGNYVETIGINAFKDNKIIKDITINYPVNIFMCAFSNSSIKNIRIEDNRGIFTDYNKSFYSGCFSECSDLETFYCNAEISGIGDRLFENCSSLKHVEFRNPITMIPEDTFSGCYNLEYVFIPATVISIPDDVFKDCNKLKSINGYVDSYVEQWCIDNGFDFNGEEFLL